jgi:hypothetical protein
MKRRELLGAGAVGLLGTGDITAVTAAVRPFGPDDSGPEYIDRASAVYERDDLRLKLPQDTVPRGESITLELTNTGESWITLRCGNPWALQKRTGGEWRHVAWTGERYYDLCASGIESGETIIEHVPTAESVLDREFGPVAAELSSGEYRIVLIGTEPYLAADFRLR